MWKCFTIRIITSIKLNYVWIDLCMFVAGRVICPLCAEKEVLWRATITSARAAATCLRLSTPCPRPPRSCAPTAALRPPRRSRPAVLNLRAAASTTPTSAAVAQAPAPREVAARTARTATRNHSGPRPTPCAGLYL